MLAPHKPLEYLHVMTYTVNLLPFPYLSLLFQSIAITELICRSAKHIFTNYIQGVEMMSLSLAVSHFLNCFLSSCSTLPQPSASDELQFRQSRRKNKRKTRQNMIPQDNNDWVNLTQKSFWSSLRNEMDSYYGYTLTSESIDSCIEAYNLQKISILRLFCIRTGIQLLLRDYHFDHKSRPTFCDEDMLNMFPVVKHIQPRASDAYNFYTTGQRKIQEGYLKDGYELINEALNLLNNVYGAMHPEIAQCLRMLARLNYIMGDHSEAISFQQKAVLMSEKVNGIDHPYTITEYVSR